MESRTASKLEHAEENLTEALNFLPGAKPCDLSDDAWQELVAARQNIVDAMDRIQECRYCEAMQDPTIGFMLLGDLDETELELTKLALGAYAEGHVKDHEIQNFKVKYLVACLNRLRKFMDPKWRTAMDSILRKAGV